MDRNHTLRRPRQALSRAVDEGFCDLVSGSVIADHPLAAFLVARTTRVSGTPGDSPTRPKGAVFTRVGQRGSVFTRLILSI
jgi:hypothetical protein